MPQYEKMLENKMNDEIKLAGFDALVAEELENHLILNSDRIRTLEDARREVVMYVEAKCDFKILDSKPSDTGLREHSEVGAVNSLSSVEGRGSSVSRVWCFECDAAHLERDCNRLSQDTAQGAVAWHHLAPT